MNWLGSLLRLSREGQKQVRTKVKAKSKRGLRRVWLKFGQGEPLSVLANLHWGPAHPDWSRALVTVFLAYPVEVLTPLHLSIHIYSVLLIPPLRPFLVSRLCTSFELRGSKQYSSIALGCSGPRGDAFEIILPDISLSHFYSDMWTSRGLCLGKHPVWLLFEKPEVVFFYSKIPHNLPRTFTHMANNEESHYSKLPSFTSDLKKTTGKAHNVIGIERKKREEKERANIFFSYRIFFNWPHYHQGLTDIPHL